MYSCENTLEKNSLLEYEMKVARFRIWLNSYLDYEYVHAVAVLCKWGLKRTRPRASVPHISNFRPIIYNYLIRVVDTSSLNEWQTVQIQISWLLKKPTDLDLHCSQRQTYQGSEGPGSNPKQFFLPLTVTRQFLCCSSSLFVRLWFHMWSLFCPYLFPISPSFGALGRMCFVIVAFSGYLHIF